MVLRLIDADTMLKQRIHKLCYSSEFSLLLRYDKSLLRSQRLLYGLLSIAVYLLGYARRIFG